MIKYIFFLFFLFFYLVSCVPFCENKPIEQSYNANTNSFFTKMSHNSCIIQGIGNMSKIHIDFPCDSVYGDTKFMIVDENYLVTIERKSY